MYARHVSLRIEPVRVDRAAAIFEEDVLPLLRVQHGFEEAFMLTAESGDGVIVIFWREASDSLRLEAAGFYREQIAKFAPVLAAPPRPLLFEVRCWARAQEADDGSNPRHPVGEAR